MNRTLTTRILILTLAVPLAAQITSIPGGAPNPGPPAHANATLPPGQPALPANPATEHKALAAPGKDPAAPGTKPAKAARHNKPGDKKKVGTLAASTPTAAAPPAPIATMSPEQLPPMPPQVSFLNGQLTILAQNSTLGDILSAVQRKTGVQIDLPPSASGQRMATQIGPAAPREALTSLLQGTNLDYIILGNNSLPGGISKVLLTVREGSTANVANGQAGNTPGRGGMGALRQPPPTPSPENVDSGEDDSTAPEPPPEPLGADQVNQPQPAQPQSQGEQPNPPQPGQPVTPPAPYGEPQNAGQGPNGAAAMQSQQPQQPQQPQVKTPAQMLEELQRMQQQQQQQQNSQQPSQ